MSFLGNITNTLHPMGKIITNSIQTIDRGINGLGITLNKDKTSTDLKNLQDLTLVNKTIANARMAVEIDPTTFSSVLSTVILANKEFNIVGDDKANPDAIDYIEKKVREWDLEKSRITTTWKGLIDGRCFIEEYINPKRLTIEKPVHLAFDENYYDFIEIPNPTTGQVEGYMQKAKEFNIPEDWETQSFDSLKNPQYSVKEIPFLPDPDTGWINVFMPRFFNGDGNSEGFVFKVLDDVYSLKRIKNIMPNAAMKAATTIDVQVGNKDFPFKPYNDSDSSDEKINKSQARMQIIGDDFTDMANKELVMHDGSITAQMLGNGTLPELERYCNFFKQEIRSALQTPDSRFESASSNRAVSQEQMSGDTGQIKVLDYIRTQFLDPVYERYLIDYELMLAGYSDSVGMIHFGYEDDNKEDELSSAQIANIILAIRPDLFDTVAPEYFPRIATELSKMNIDNPVKPIQQGEPVVNSLGTGFVDNTDYAQLILNIKHDLKREGIPI